MYVLIVDWGIRAHPFTAPLRLQAQLVSIHRRAAIGALRSQAAPVLALGALRTTPRPWSPRRSSAPRWRRCWGALPAAQSAAWCCSCSRDGG